MKRVLLGAIMMVVAVGFLSGCGVKSPPKYSPDTQKSEQKKS